MEAAGPAVRTISARMTSAAGRHEDVVDLLAAGFRDVEGAERADHSARRGA